MKTSKSSKKMKNSTSNKTFEIVIYALLVLLVLIGAYFVYNLVNPETLTGKAWGDSIHDIIVLVTHGENGLFVNLNPTVEHPTDFTSSMHYNWKKRVVGDSKPITVVNLPIENIITNQVGDISGNNNYGTVNNGAITSDGILGKSLSFDGVDDYVTIGDSNLVLDNDFTIEMWFKSPDNKALLFGNEITLIPYVPKNNFVISLIENTDASKNLKISWYGFDSQNNYIPSTIPEIKTIYNDNSWNHLVVTYLQTQNKLNLYLNGELINSIDYKNSFVPEHLQGPFYLGAPSSILEFYNGFIDEFKLYDIALTPEQVKANYESVMDANGNVKDTAHYTAYNTLIPNMNKECGKWEVDGYLFRESGAFDKRLTTNILDTLCAVGQTCQEGVCVEEQPQQDATCTPECEQGKTCVSGACIPTLALGESFCTDDNVKVTLTAINQDGTFDFEISECGAAVVVQPTLTLTHEDAGDFVAEVKDLPTEAESVHYNWYDLVTLKEQTYDSITLFNLPMEAMLVDVSGNTPQELTLMAGNEDKGTSIPSYLIPSGVVGFANALGAVGYTKDYYIKVTSSLLENLDEFSMELWLFVAPDTSGPIFSSSSLSLFANNGYVFFQDDKVKNYCNDNNQPVFYFGPENKGAWNHLLLTYKENNVKVMINNKEYCTFSYEQPINLKDMNIGKWEDAEGSEYLSKSALDEFKIYSRALSPEQITANYDSVMETNTVEGVVITTLKTDASTNAYNRIVVQENLACKNWKVTATLFQKDGSIINLDQTSENYCTNGCDKGLCLDVTNCATDDNCATNPQNKKCLIEQEKANDGNNEQCTEANDCSVGYSCNKDPSGSLICMKGTCVNPAYECLSNTDCTDTTKPNCVNNICSSTVQVDTPPPPPSDTSSSSGTSSGGSSSGGSSSSNQCMLPQDSVKCHAQKAYTPCVQDKIIYKCLSKCGTSLLFQYDCKGNTPSYAQGCNNKIKDIGEEGVDCGGKCKVKCPDFCFNNKKDADEYGIDCGGKKCAPCEEPIVKKETPIVTLPPTQPTQTTPPVVETPLFDKIKGYWWTLIPFLLLIGLIVFLITRTSHPHEEVIAGIEQPEELRKPFKSAELPKETREETSMKKDELKEFIKKELGQGKDRDEITKNLERIGYNIDDVNSVFDEELHNALPKEYEQQLRKYVAYYLDKGNSAEEIREKLKAQGWSDEVIDKFLVR
ncbi:LamG domain-containing protein [Candidatus Woesearchaeota archaeon]|nr:LamG domain-containing protein [Candidatus Woesearchaeota archaeon]